MSGLQLCHTWWDLEIIWHKWLLQQDDVSTTKPNCYFKCHIAGTSMSYGYNSSYYYRHYSNKILNLVWRCSIFKIDLLYYPSVVLTTDRSKACSGVGCSVSVWGIHVTKWLGTRSLLLFSPHKVGFFKISLFIPNEICSNKALSTRKSSSFW